MSSHDISAILAQLEQAVGKIERATDAIADTLAMPSDGAANRQLRAEVDAAIGELSMMIGDTRG